MYSVAHIISYNPLGVTQSLLIINNDYKFYHKALIITILVYKIDTIFYMFFTDLLH